MPQLHSYKWTAFDLNGNKVSGIISGNNTQEILNNLRSEKLFIINLRKLFQFKNKIASNVILHFFEELSTLLSSGLNLLTALDILQKNFKNKSMQFFIKNLQQDIQAGHSFEFALQQFPNHIQKIYCQLIKIGETTGQLGFIIKQIIDHKKKTELLKKNIYKALIYPSTVAVVSTIIIFMILYFVIPNFMSLFQQFGAKLPFYTQIVILLAKNLPYFAALVGISIISFIFIFIHAKKYKNLILKIEKLILRIPMIGSIIKHSELFTFSYSLLLTLRSGINLPDALNLCSQTFKFNLFTTYILKTHADILSGLQFSNSLKQHTHFSDYYLQMIEVGQETGSFLNVLDILTQHYENKFVSEIEMFTTLLEPILMILLGIILGGVITALYLPIFKLGNII